MTEKYILDPVLKSTVRIVNDDDGLFYAFLADGAELVADTADDICSELAAYWVTLITKTA